MCMEYLKSGLLSSRPSRFTRVDCLEIYMAAQELISFLHYTHFRPSESISISGGAEKVLGICQPTLSYVWLSGGEGTIIVYLYLAICKWEKIIIKLCL